MLITKGSPMKKIISIISLTAIIIAAPVMACDKDGRLAKALNLSEAQISQLQSIQGNRKDQREQHKQHKDAYQQQKKALMTDYSSEKAQALAQSMADDMAKAMLQRLEKQQAIYAILDDEQKAKFLELDPRPRKGRHDKQGDDHGH